jgi:hypothetical protein
MCFNRQAAKISYSVGMQELNKFYFCSKNIQKAPQQNHHNTSLLKREEKNPTTFKFLSMKNCTFCGQRKIATIL